MMIMTMGSNSILREAGVVMSVAHSSRTPLYPFMIPIIIIILTMMMSITMIILTMMMSITIIIMTMMMSITTQT